VLLAKSCKLQAGRSSARNLDKGRLKLEEGRLSARNLC
jgi:hypothetical protein